MNEFLWFAAGAAVATAATMLTHRFRRRPPMHSAPGDEAGAVAPPPEDSGIAERRLAVAISEEMATLVSGVDGAAHALIECAPERIHLPRAAENLLAAVKRLRTLHDKLRAYGAEESTRSGRSHVAPVVQGLIDELQHLRLGLEIETAYGSDLPPAALPSDVLRSILLYTCGAMFRSESGATHLSITSELSLGDDSAALRIELMLEWPGDPGKTPGRTTHDPRVALALEAATRLARRHGAEVTLSYPPGRAVKTLLVLPAATNEPIPEESDAEPVPTTSPRADEPATPRHSFGGALVVEADPAVRGMLARELRHAGRAVFACADAASARTFLEATPDRFELLFVDHRDRLDRKDTLGQAVHRLTPNLKVCVLGPCEPELAAEWPDVVCIEKPFGVHELRRALASVLQAG